MLNIDFDALTKDMPVLSFDEKKKILDFLNPYMRANKISLAQVKALLSIEDAYEMVEFGYPAALWTQEELHESMKEVFENE